MLRMKSLSKKKYEKICKKCDFVLNSYGSRNEIVAINFLHVIRSSATTIQRYVVFLDNDYWVYSFLRHCYLFIKNIVDFFYNFIYSIFYQKHNFPNKVCKVDFLFISHYTVTQGKSTYAIDSYFGDILNNIHKNGRSSVVAYINHTSSKTATFKKIDSVIPILLSNVINFIDLMHLYKGVFVARRSLGNNSSNDPLLVKVIKQAKINIFSKSTIRNLILAKQVEDIVKKYSPNLLIATYEGHAWERLVFSASRSVSPNIRCISYQHAPVFKFQHAIRRNLEKKYNPDVILTSGQVPATQLSLSKELSGTQISVIGSSRNIVLKSKKLTVMQEFEAFSCLVAPEGDLEECNILLFFALDCANNNQGVNFIWRLPPMIDIDILLKNNRRFVNLPDNVVISEVDLLNDILKSNTILYRGSSVVIQAVVFGLKPIYFKIDNELTIDPLYEISRGREIVCNIEDFQRSLTEKIDMSDKGKLIRYCQNMYTQIDVDVIEKLSKFNYLSL